MKIKTLLKTFLILAALILSQTANAEYGEGFKHFKLGKLAYNLNNDGITVSVTYEYQIGYLYEDNQASYSDLNGSIEIPPSITYCGYTYPVTSIDDGAFYRCKKITKVTIPNSVTSIGQAAFKGCSGLKNITIGNSVKTIGNGAFSGCIGLTSVTIPNSVTSIGGGAFYGCIGLTSVTIPNSVSSIGGGAFQGCIGLISVTIPNSVTTIGGNAFDGIPWFDNQPDGLVYAGLVAYRYKGTMPNGSNITIKEGTKGIGDNCFADCSGLTSVTIPNSVVSIGDEVFSGCFGLSSITIPQSVTEIGNSAFKFCSNLSNIIIPNSVTNIGANALEETAWYSNQPNGLVYAGLVAYRYKGVMPDGTNITLKEGTKEINDKCFADCRGLTSVTIPNSVVSIGDEAFSGCFGLTSITIPQSVTEVGQKAFFDCKNITNVFWNAESVKNNKALSQDLGIFQNSNLRSIVFGNNVSSIPNYLCHKQSSITNITIPNSVTYIGDYAFFGCTGLTSIIIPNSVTYIGNGAFSNCTGLTSATLGNSVISIGSVAFSCCNSLTGTLTIPNSVRVIGSSAFFGNNGFTSAYIGKSVRFIGEYAFACYRLTNVTWNVKSCNDYHSFPRPINETCYHEPPFDINESITYIEFGNEVERIPSGLCAEVLNLESITISKSVKEIGAEALNFCENLTSVYITDIAKWCNINFILGSNPLSNQKANLYLNGKKVSDLVIPRTVTSISNYAFYRYQGLTSITIPSTVTSIGEKAFSSCSNVSNIFSYIKNPINVTLGNSVFDGLTKNGKCTLHVPHNTVQLYRECDQWKDFLVIHDDLDEESSITTGDVDGNGIIDVDDVNAAINIILKLNNISDYPGRCDMDNNGIIDVDDVNAMINIILKLV